MSRCWFRIQGSEFRQWITRCVQSNATRGKSLKILVLLLAVYLSSLPAFGATYKYVLFGRELIETRLKSFSRNDTKREIILKDMFTEAGCGEHISEPAVDRVKQPELVCVLPGQSERVIIVGAHFDHVDAGDGLVDNWSGASLLPTLYQ